MHDTLRRFATGAAHLALSAGLLWMAKTWALQRKPAPQAQVGGAAGKGARVFRHVRSRGGGHGFGGPG